MGSSSSSSSPERFSTLVRRSLSVLRAEHPESYAVLCRDLRGERLGLAIDGEEMTVAFTGGEAEVLERGGGETVGFGSARRTLIELLDGRLTLLEAIESGGVYLRGEVAAMARFHDGLVDYLRGAVRCPGFPALMKDLRADAATPPGTWDPAAMRAREDMP